MGARYALVLAADSSAATLGASVAYLGGMMLKQSYSVNGQYPKSDGHLRGRL